MNPFINCKYESIYNILRIYEKKSNLINKLYYFKLLRDEKNILTSKNLGKVNFEDFLSIFGIKEKRIKETKNLENFLKQYMNSNKIIVIKTDLYYQNFSKKYYNRKHKRHNLLIKNVYNENVEVIEHDYADSSNFITQNFTYEEIQEWYDGYINNYYNTKVDESETIYIYSKSEKCSINEDIINTIMSYSDEIKTIKDNIEILKDYYNYATMNERMISFTNILNYKIIEKEKFNSTGDNEIEEIIRNEINILKNICKSIINDVKYNELFEEYLICENKIKEIMELKSDSYSEVILRYKNYVTSERSIKIIKERNMDKIHIDSNRLLIDLSENDESLNEIESLNLKSLIEISCRNYRLVETELELGYNAIKRQFKDFNYDIEYINKQNNSINGYISKGKMKFFYKILCKEDALREIKGYIQIYNKISIAKLVEVIEFKNSCVLIFEYDKNITRDNGLLNDFFVKKEANKKIYNEDIETIRNIINEYFLCTDDAILSEKYPMQKFFEERVDKRLKEWYKKENFLKMKIEYKGKDYELKKIIQDIIKYFKICKKRECFITQGDPNSMNIGIKPIFFDYATSGYNPLVAECSTFIWSILFADLYFAPKYHPNSYYNHTRIFDELERYNDFVSYEINKKKGKIIIKNFSPKTTRIRKYTTIEYMETLKKRNMNISNEIFYFIAMRILCIFNLGIMEEKDMIYSVLLLISFKEIIEDSEYINDSIKNFINSLEEL